MKSAQQNINRAAQRRQDIQGATTVVALVLIGCIPATLFAILILA